MAPRFTRRKDDAKAREDAKADGTDGADLAADEHAWWAQRDVQAAWAPHAAPETGEAERDVLAEHFGPDWRDSFELPHSDGPPREDDLAPPEPFELLGEPLDTSDPYKVLEVAPTATWEEIVAAHRRMARRHHPDRYADRPRVDVEAAEERIRAINVAYAELRVRRGK